MNDLRERVVAEARGWLGTPYHHAARLRGIGVDCYEDTGLIPHTEPEPYPMQWHLHRGEERFLAWIQKYGVQISVDELAPGDVVLYQFARCASHGAIVTEWPNIIHAWMAAGRVEASDAYAGDLAGRLHSAWTFEAFK
jgi:cell wall-associated NlpC family hydrolase